MFSTHIVTNTDTFISIGFFLTFITGLLDISKDPVFSSIFDNLPKDCGSDRERLEEQSYFMDHVNDLSMQLTLYQECVQQYKNLFVIDSDWSVSSVVKLAEDKYVKNLK